MLGSLLSGISILLSGLHFDYVWRNRKIKPQHSSFDLAMFMFTIVCVLALWLLSVRLKNGMDFGYCVITLQNKAWLSIKLSCAIYKCNLIRVVHCTGCVLALFQLPTIATTLINYAFEILLRNWDNALDKMHTEHTRPSVQYIFMETARAII